jgi:hypothetical protein
MSVVRIGPEIIKTVPAEAGEKRESYKIRD